MNVPEHPVVLATVKSKAEEVWRDSNGDDHTGWKLELDVPEFRSQYAVLCSRVDTQLAAQLKLGQTARVVLTRQKIRKSQDGSPKAGNYYTDYYWGLERVATETDAPDPAPVVTAQATPGNTGHRGDRNETSIEAQCAYKGAIELLVAGIRAGAIKVDEAGDALTFLTWQGFQAIRAAKTGEHTGEAPTPPTTPCPTGPAESLPAAATPPGKSDDAQTQTPGASPTNIPRMATYGDVQRWVRTRWPDRHTSDVWAAVGLASSAQCTLTPQELATQLLKIWGAVEVKS